MNLDTPIVFADGTNFYAELAKDYIRHDRGLFILAPSGVGKSYFVDRQAEKHWIDGDYLWPATGADLSDESWNNDTISVKEINLRSDVITLQAKKLGFWIIGSSNAGVRPDAIVLPPWDVHQKYIIEREKAVRHYGATADDFEAVLRHRSIIEKWSVKGVPVYVSVEEAVKELTNLKHP